MGKGKLLAGIAAMFAIYVAAAPYIAVHQMKYAAASRDGEALSEYIEFPSVRQSLKDQMNAAFMKEMTNELEGNPFAAVGAAFAGMMVDKLVDAYVTPAGITQLMLGENPNQNESGEPAGDSAQEPFANASMSYDSLSKFVVTVKGDTGDEGKFILRRRGIGWKLTEILIPIKS